MVPTNFAVQRTRIVLAASFSALLILTTTLTPSAARAAEPKWIEQREHRVLVRVDPIDIAQRKQNGAVASFKLDFSKIGRGRGDLASLVIVQYDPKTGEVIDRGLNAYADTPGELPIRFYDDKIPMDYPDAEGYLNHETGRSTPVTKLEGAGRLFNVLGDNRAGKLAWVHQQQGREPSFYAIYFNELKEGALATQAKPGLLGDGANRFIKDSSEFAPIIHGRIALGDFNGDGNFDMVMGNLTGSMFLYENFASGSDGPKFGEPHLILEDNGQPLDVGWAASPAVADWNGDGLLDLVIGCEKETVVYYKNVGTKTKPSFKHMGCPQVDGKPLRIPHQPCKEDPENKIYPIDYNAMPDVGDWNGDGALDLLVGGYITGVFFYYENTAPKNAEPKLTYRGIIQADGKDADVGWVATPCIVDLNSDGKLDLVSGCMPLDERGADGSDAEQFLWYFENTGTREKVLSHRPFPKKNTFGYGAMGAPRAVDFNKDGLVDLIVCVNSHLLLMPNIGTKDRPMFDAAAKAVLRPMGNGSMGFHDLLDYNKDGWPDAFAYSRVLLNDGEPNPGLFSKTIELKGAQKILHPSPRGDHWDQRILADIDGDGPLDIVVGDHGGNMWFHRNNGTQDEPQYDTAGEKLAHRDGQPIRVGIPPGGKQAEFDVLQGARTHMTAFDVDKDGALDIVGADTFGQIYLFMRDRGGAADGDAKKPRFKQAVMLESAMPKVRLMVRNVDWNGDEWQDVLAVHASGKDTFILLNEPGGAGGGRRFGSPQRITVPPAWGDNFTYVADWNNDGDQDLVITGYGYLRVAERTYLERGYLEAKLIKHVRRSAAK